MHISSELLQTAELSASKFGLKKLSVNDCKKLVATQWPNLIEADLCRMPYIKFTLFDPKEFHIQQKQNGDHLSEYNSMNLLDEQGCSYLKRCDWPQLKKIVLTNNCIGDKGCKHLSEANWRLLQEIYLQNNEISVGGSKSLAEAQWPLLRRIELSYNLIGDGGCQYLCRANWPCMKEFSITKGQINSEGVGHLAMANWPLLQIFRFTQNQIGNQGCLSLLKAKWPNLLQIYIDKCLIGDEGFQYLSRAFWPKLNFIKMDQNINTVQGIRSIGKIYLFFNLWIKYSIFELMKRSLRFLRYSQQRKFLFAYTNLPKFEINDFIAKFIQSYFLYLKSYQEIFMILINKLMMDYIHWDSKIHSVQMLPVSLRRNTDICCIYVHAIFNILIFVICQLTFNIENIRKITYPNDSQGRLCGYDEPDFPYLYFTSLEDKSKRLCVSQCPDGTSSIISCKPTASLNCQKNTNPQHQVQIYQSFLDRQHFSHICMPAIGQSILEIRQFKNIYQILGFYDVMWSSAWISAILGLIFFILLFFYPYRIVPWGMLIGGIMLAISGIFILFLDDVNFIVKIIFFCFLLILAIFTFITLVSQYFQESIYIGMRIIHSAANICRGRHNTTLPSLSLQGLKLLIQPLILIVAFMHILAAFLALIAFESLSILSCADFVFVGNQPFYRMQKLKSSFLVFLIIIQLIWGLSFIKESFNFIVSSYAAHCYYYQSRKVESEQLRHQKPSYCSVAFMMARYHWGSICVGSFLSGFFYFINLLFSLIKTENLKIRKNFNRSQIGYYREVINAQGVFNYFKIFFDLIREDIFAYTYLTNLSFCNSSRYCQFLSQHSRFFDFSPRILRLIRLNMQILPIFLALSISVFIIDCSDKVNPWGLFFTVLISYCMTTYSLAYQCNTAEGLLISAFLQQALIGVEPLLAPQLIKKAYYENNQYLYVDKDKAWINILIEPIQTE